MSVKISELPILDSLADNDVIAGVDTSANVTSKIEMATLKNYIDTNTQYTAGTNIDITDNVISAPFVYDKTQTNALLDDFKDETNASIEDLKDEKDEQIEELQSEIDSLSTIFNAFPTESGEGESLTLDDTAEVKFKKFDLKGNTSQITYTGKNLLNLNLSKSINRNGITYSVARDGTITINGTATANVDIQYLNEALQTLANTKYCLNYIYVSGSLNGTIHVFNQDSSHGWNGWNMDLTASNSGHNVVTLTSFTTDMNMSGAKTIRVDNGAVLNNLKFKLQFTKSESADYDYEPYVGGIPSPNPTYPQPINVVSGDNEIEVCGKNLLQLTNDKETFNYQNTHTIEDNVYVGIPTANWAQTRYKFYLEKNTQYTFSSKLSFEGSNFPSKWQVTIKGDDDTNIFSGLVNIIDNKISVSFNSGENDYNEISFWSRTNDSSRDITKTTYSEVQLEKSSSASTYEPYQGNTYNIDLPVENLLPPPSNSSSSTGVGNMTLTWNTSNDFHLSGSATSTGNVWGGTVASDYTIKEGDYLHLCNDSVPSGTIQFVGLTPTTTQAFVATINSKNKVLDLTSYVGKTIHSVFFYCVSGASADMTMTPMIVNGMSKVLSFTPYGTTPIELYKIGNYKDYFYKGTGKNLLPNNATTQTINGVTFKVNDDKSVTLNGTASAIADFYMFGSSTDTGEYLYIPKGTYSISTPSSGWFYIGREKTLGAVVGNMALLNALSSQDCYFYGFIIRATSGSSFSNLTLSPMINEGTTALPYEPYGSKDKWYLHKEIGKVVLNGSETIDIYNQNTSRTNFQVKDILSGVESYTNSGSIPNLLSNRFITNTQGATWVVGNMSRRNAEGVNEYLYLTYEPDTTIEAFKTWLGTNNVPVYYVYATPTNIEITYQPLIDQLNLLEQAQSKENQTNISQVSNDKPFILDVIAIKSLQSVLDRIELLES